MKPITLGRYASVNDLKDTDFPIKNDIREKVKILIVDDEPFVYLDKLQASNYNVRQVPDINDINAIAEYAIVICDINGIGSHFSDTRWGGAFMANQMQKIYPYKYYAVYSGKSSYPVDIAGLLNGIITIKKDADISQWCGSIDSMIQMVTSPKCVWNNVRKELLKREIPMMTILQLEDEYVRTIQKEPKLLKTFPNAKYNQLTEDVRGIIQSLIAGFILAVFSI